MEEFVFRKLCLNDVPEITEFKHEFEAYQSGMDGTGNLFRSSAEAWLKEVSKMEDRENPDTIPCLQYGLFQDNQKLLGLIQIRLVLKGYLISFGGHIGYCVRPTQRRKGYAKAMLEQALAVCKDEGLKKVLVTCLEDNIGSEKTILCCGGVYDKTVYDNLNYKANMKRYWITI